MRVARPWEAMNARRRGLDLVLDIGNLGKVPGRGGARPSGLRACVNGSGGQLGWRLQNRVGETRGAMLESSLLPVALKAGRVQSTGDQEWPSHWRQSSPLTLCFPSGSECATSCLDHNSESIILPVNVTVRDIPHWLNPTRVEVSDGLPTCSLGNGMTLWITSCALVLL